MESGDEKLQEEMALKNWGREMETGNGREKWQWKSGDR